MKKMINNKDNKRFSRDYKLAKALNAYKEINSLEKLISNNEEVYTYILLCSDNTLYCGWTNNLIKRFKAHNEGKGAKYTKGRKPVRLVYFETFTTKEEAMKREYAIKQLSRKEKEELILNFDYAT